MFGHHESAQATVLSTGDVSGGWEDVHHVKIEFVLEVHPPTGQAFRTTATQHFIRFTHYPQVGDMVNVKYDPKSLKVELDLKDDIRYGEARLKHQEQAERQAAQARRDALLAAPPGTSHKTKEQWLDEGDLLYFTLKRPEGALAAFEQALHLDPTSVRAWNNKGMMLLVLKRYDEALAAFEQALHLDPNNAEVWTNKGTTLREMQRYDEALAAFEQVLALDPNNVDAWNTRGMIFLDLKRYDEALAAFERSLRLNPNEGAVHHLKGQLLEALGRRAEAEYAFSQARQLGYTG